ncbi:hypothetical protein MTO96_027314 [Rhipicephalus appendiculatus]
MSSEEALILATPDANTEERESRKTHGFLIAEAGAEAKNILVVMLCPRTVSDGEGRRLYARLGVRRHGPRHEQ